ncbi:ABC transporter substrate-binding protein [Amphibiibacter pelophylacis]|uniref:ABC transporter substrate-binding protein n=1 Tax=Amphibiibacter pelophylacis TaxID=1799477 RepID=A0ACC6P4G5_9BURK
MKQTLKITALALASLLATAAHAQTGPVRIGFITDMSGVYSDIDGQAGGEAIKMAVADFGGNVLGRKIEVLTADHQNKADVAATKAREWVDQQGVNMVVGGTNSAAALATARIMADKKVPYFIIGAGSSRLTNEDCTPYNVHYAYDTVALARVSAKALVDKGDKSWYFLTADYAFGHSLEKDATEIVKGSGGTVAGAVRHPLGASDFSSFLLQAQASKAQVLGLANAGGDFINSVKAANEFGITKTMKLAGLLVFINDIHSLGLKTAQGLLVTDSWYWDQNDDTRKFASRFIEKFKRMPSSLQAADYSATLTWLKAVKAAGTTDGAKVMEQLRKTPINDMFVKNGTIRADGRMVRDMYLLQVKTPAESTKPWDYYKLLQTVPGSKAYTTLAESKCSLVKK